MVTLEQFALKVKTELEDSDLEIVPLVKIEKIKSEFPKIPDDYLELISKVGWGSYGKVGFAIYNSPITPDHIFDPETAKTLIDCVLVGDDYSGYMIGYQQIENEWIFTEFDHSEIIRCKESAKNIIDFLHKELFDD